MEEQVISAVDDTGRFLRYISKNDAHKGNGIRHLAITVFIFNYKGEILLQKRKHKVFDNIWDNTASTHQLHLENGKDETDEEATLRCLKDEWGIDDIKLKTIGAFNYFAKYGNLCENEYCKLLIGEFNGEVKLNPDVGYEYKWIDKNEFLNDVQTHPSKYTPWCKEAVIFLKDKGIL